MCARAFLPRLDIVLSTWCLSHVESDTLDIFDLLDNVHILGTLDISDILEIFYFWDTFDTLDDTLYI